MARDAAHDTFVHTLETMAAMVKADSGFPVPTKQTVISVRVPTNEDVHEFATTHNLGAPTRVRDGWLYVDIPFGALIYRVASGSH